MQSHQFLPLLKKVPKRSSLSSKLPTKQILIALIFFTAIFYSSFSYSQNLQTITSSSNEADKIEISEGYPNPALHYIQFDYRMIDRSSKGKIIVYNLLGSIVGEHQLNNYDNRLKISVDNLKTGIYFYTISINNQSLITKKFIVKH